METIDLKKLYRDLYRAKEVPEEVIASEGTFLAADGRGEPGGDSYQRTIEALYGVAYTMKFSLKGAGVLDFKVPHLECLWYSDPNDTPLSEWEWRLLIRVPDRVSAAHLTDAQQRLHEKKGTDASVVRRLTWEEGRAIQVLHIGPYDRVTTSYGKVWEYAREHGLEVEGIGHEVYLSDPRRTAPEKLKTIVRMPVKIG